jgi:secreted trypsin-like serine protease
MHRGLVAGAWLALTLVSQAGASERIVGGTPVAPDDPIAAVTVALAWQDVVLCSGVLLDYDLVLTAAHCLSLADEVVFGTDAESESAPRRRILAKLAHPAFDAFRLEEDPMPRGLNDIALVRISSPLPLASRPAELLAASAPLENGEKVTIAGFGVDDAGALSGQGKLRKAEVRLLSNEYAASEFQIDASRGSGDCSGDSGGPAFVTRKGRLVVAGVDNWGPGLCDEFGVYARVGHHREWIEEASRELRRDTLLAPLQSSAN